MLDLAVRPVFTHTCEGIHRSTSLMSSLNIVGKIKESKLKMNRCSNG